MAAAIIVINSTWSCRIVLVSEDTLCFSVSMWPVEGDMQSLSLHVSCIIDKCAEILWTHKPLCRVDLDAKASKASLCRGSRPAFNLHFREARNLHEIKIITALWLTLQIAWKQWNCLNTQIVLVLLRCRDTVFTKVLLLVSFLLCLHCCKALKHTSYFQSCKPSID